MIDFYLQLFAIGEGEENSEGAGVESTAENNANESKQPTCDYGLLIDPETGSRSIQAIGQADTVIDGDEKGNEEPQHSTSDEEVNKEESTETLPYTPNELIRAITMNQVDESRIPGELQGDYVAMKTQRELEIIKQQQAQETKEATQKPPEQLSPKQNEIENIIKRNEQINGFAEQYALKQLGMTAQQLQDIYYDDTPESQSKVAQYNHNVAAFKQAVEAKLVEEQIATRSQRHESEQILKESVPIIKEYMKDPEFAAIDQMMNSYYQKLPYDQAAQVVQATQRVQSGNCSSNDMLVLDAYYKATREAYYAQKNGISRTPQKAEKPAKPPVVETPGAGGSSVQQKVDYKKMRTMDARERSEFVRDLLKSSQ